MNTKINIGERIAYYRRLNAMTQEELAQKLNISTQAVSKWEQKITSPDIMLLPELASIFNISIDELFGKKVAFCLIDTQKTMGNMLMTQSDSYKISFYSANHNQPSVVVSCKRLMSQTINGEEAQKMSIKYEKEIQKLLK